MLLILAKHAFISLYVVDVIGLDLNLLECNAGARCISNRSCDAGA